MYNIQLSIKIKATPDTVFNVLKSMDEFSQMMHYVKDVKIETSSKNRIITKWLLDVEGADVTWKEEDLFDDKNKSVKFSMLEGDYGSYFGTWKIKPLSPSSLLTLDINVDWDIPSFEKVIGPILENKTKRILRGMMAAIKLKAQKLSREQTKK
ncbi:MAG: SRPBCC family protein [Candidatus Omnitrophota bacterium]